MIRLLDLAGGLDLDSPKDKIADNQSPHMEGFELGPGPTVSVAKDFTEYKILGTTPIAIYKFKRKSGAERLVIVAGKYVYDVTDGIESVYTFAVAPSIANFATWRDKCFIATNTSKLLCYDGETVTEINETPHGCTFICLQENRLFLAGELENPSWLYYSNLGDETKWKDPETNIPNVIEVATNDGTKITGLAPQLGEVVIFKNKTMWKLVGTSPTDWQLVRVSGETGCIAPKTIAVIDDQLIFLTERGIYLAGSDSVTLISEPIKPVLKDADPSLLYGLMYGFQYWLSDGVDVYIYDLTRGAWTYRKDDYMQSMMADGLDLYGAKDGILYKLDKSRNVQYARFDTKEFLTEFPEIEKRFRRLIIQARIPMGMCLDVSVKIDGEFMPEIFTLTEPANISLPPSYIGKKIQVVVEAYSDVGVGFGLTTIDGIHIDDKPLRRRYN